MSKTLLGIVVVILIAGGIFLYTNEPAEAPTEPVDHDGSDEAMMEEKEGDAMMEEKEGDSMMEEKDGDGAMMEKGKEHVISMTNSGYSPKEITVKKGDIVVFRNDGTEDNWPASALHPTHKVYPGSDIRKCGTEEADAIFDACRGIKAGESWSFKFNEAGEWPFHDHLNSRMFGKIIVEE